MASSDLVSAGSVFRNVHPHAAGVDVGNGAHYVAVPPESCAAAEPCVRRFDTFTADLYALADWLQQHAVTTVALESTGVYWIPLFEVLESRGFEVCLVDTRRLKSVPGRKTDVKDCQWLQQLHTCGLLHSAFRPDEEICVLRTYLRQREMLIASAAEHIQHLQKALQQMNVKLSNVLSDITGLTGMAIIQAILDGERDPVKLAQHRDPRCKQPEEVIAEIGRDITRWPSVKHFCSWLCLCPGNKKSGGKVLSSRTRRSRNRAATALRLAAQSLERSQTALGAYYRRMKAHLGAPEAITATAHKLARIIYSLMKHGQSYVDIGQETYEQLYQSKIRRSLERKAKALGIQLIPLPNAV